MDRLLRKYNKHRKVTGTYVRKPIPTTATTNKYVQYQIDRYTNHGENFPVPIEQDPCICSKITRKIRNSYIIKGWWMRPSTVA